MKYDFLRIVIMGWKIAFYYPGVKMINWCWEENVSAVTFITRPFCICAQFHCVRCLIEVLLEIVMILPSHQQGFVRADTAHNLFLG